MPHRPNPEETEGDPRSGAAGHDSAARAPAHGFPTSGSSSPGKRGAGSKLAGLPGGPTALWTPRWGPASRQAPQCPLRARQTAHRGLLSRAGDSLGLPLLAPPEHRAALSDSSLLPIREPLGWGGGGGGRAEPLAGPEEKRILARVLAARNRFIRDLIPVLSGSSQAWEPVKICRRQRGCQQVSTVDCAFPSPQDQSLPHPIW